jgi:hypothetical protein
VKRSFNLGIRCELAAFCLSETFQHVGKVRRVDRFGFNFIAHEAQHRACDLILAIWRRTASSACSSSFVIS